MKAQLSWLDDPETFRVNQLPAHSDHSWYRNRTEASAHQSNFFQSLDGEWQFKFAADSPNIPEPFINPPVIIVITAQSRFPE